MKKEWVWITGGAVVLAVIALQAAAVSSGAGSALWLTALFGGIPPDVDPNGWGGTIVDEVPLLADLGAIDPATDGDEVLVFEDARFQVNGVALRDCRMGGISLTGIPAGSEILRAYLYWQWACLEQPVPGLHDTIRFFRVYPPPRTGMGDITGTLVGTGANPCWCGPQYANYNYRADVTAVIDPDQGGTYGVVTIGGAAGSVDYVDPWVAVGFPACDRAVEPLLNGAALVVVYRSACEDNGTVVLYDAGLSGTMFTAIPGLIFSLAHPAAPGNEARWGLVAGDGQIGFGYAPFFGFGTETTFVNGTQVAGPTTLYNDSQWNGSIGKPLPQLYETCGLDISPLVVAGSTSTSVVFSGEGAGIADCVVPTACVLWVR